MFFLGGVTAFFKCSGVNGDLFPFAVYLDDAPGIDHLCFLANVGIRNTVVMFVLTQIDMVVLGYLMFSVILDLKGFYREPKKMLFLIGQELFLSAIVLLLHPGLVVKLHLFTNRFI